MTAARIVADVLGWTGVVAVVAGAWGALLPRPMRGRLHFLTPVTSLGAPLIGLGIAVDTGWHLATAIVVFTVLLVVATGPLLAAAIGRVSAQRDDLISTESPE